MTEFSLAVELVTQAAKDLFKKNGDSLEAAIREAIDMLYEDEPLEYRQDLYSVVTEEKLSLP